MTDYHLARSILADRRFSRAAAVLPDVPRLSITDPAPESIISLDGSDHARMRRFVVGAFTERRLQELQPFVEKTVSECLETLSEQGSPAGFVSTVAQPLPLRVLSHMLGVPSADREIFGSWVSVLFDLTGNREENRSHAFGLTRYMSGLVAQKRREPGDDLLSNLVQLKDRGEGLSTRELITLCLSLLMAGYETTIDQITLCVLSLLYDPSLAAALRADPDLTPSVVEELIRLSPSAFVSFARATRESVRLDDVTIEPGQPVVVFILGANHSSLPAGEGENARTGHLTFGHGVHRCLGAPLARMQLATVIRALVERFPRLAIAEDPETFSWKTGMATRGLTELRVRW
ncbi:cytochrome P450 [Streptomyces sp. ADI93-02]|uniref:cytochrome P450 n=1 Tax=Streptomyces sp. ADI93-02 TaxID=1522757 RepID=UPI0013DE2F26|nr:cytochrome P450 [Streptomyces sp. ADI93-02]